MFWKDNHRSNGISPACTGMSFTRYLSCPVDMTFPFISIRVKLLLPVSILSLSRLTYNNVLYLFMIYFFGQVA